MYLPKNRIVNLNKFYFEHFPNAKDLISLSDGKTISREVLTDENEFSKYV